MANSPVGYVTGIFDSHVSAHLNSNPTFVVIIDAADRSFEHEQVFSIFEINTHS
jgi:hypothetical protein